MANSRYGVRIAAKNQIQAVDLITFDRFAALKISGSLGKLPNKSFERMSAYGSRRLIPTLETAVYHA